MCNTLHTHTHTSEARQLANTRAHARTHTLPGAKVKRSRGFGFVRFQTFEEAQAAASRLDGHPVAGKTLRIKVQQRGGRVRSGCAFFFSARCSHIYTHIYICLHICVYICVCTYVMCIVYTETRCVRPSACATSPCPDTDQNTIHRHHGKKQGNCG